MAKGKARIEFYECFLKTEGHTARYKWRLLDAYGFCIARSPDQEYSKSEVKEAALRAKRLMAEAEVEK